VKSAVFVLMLSAGLRALKPALILTEAMAA
jgi:hypothetical protein